MRKPLLQPLAYNPRPAFTLLEVLIVVAIVALLVAVMVTAWGPIDEQAKIALTKNCLDTLDAALRRFHDITGRYPVDTWADIDDPGSLIAGASQIDGADEPSSSELLYLQLNVLPKTRDMIAGIDGQLLVQPLDSGDNSITVELADQLGVLTPDLRRIVDAWGNVLIYDDHDDPDRFPLIYSCGPDTTFGTEDDITNED